MDEGNRITGEATTSTPDETTTTEAVLVINGDLDAESDLFKCCELSGQESKSCYAVKSSACDVCTEICG